MNLDGMKFPPDLLNSFRELMEGNYSEKDF